MPLIMYYEYTKDDDFLRNKLYPLLKALDAFWRDYTEKEELANAVPVTSSPQRRIVFLGRRRPGRESRSRHRLHADSLPDAIGASRELGVDADMVPCGRTCSTTSAPIQRSRWMEKSCSPTKRNGAGSTCMANR